MWRTRSLTGVCAAGLLVVLLGGCATPPLTQQLLLTPPAAVESAPAGALLPRRHELTDTPFFPQQAYQCGPAALATVLNYHGVSVTPAQLAPRVYLPQRQGSLQLELTAAARAHGMLAYPLRADLRDLLREVAAGHPVLVLQNLGVSWWPKWHYAVVVGYDLERRELVLRSGVTRRWRTSLANFERTWARGQHWALALLPAGRVPATATLASYLQAAFDLEQTGQLDSALRAYRAATQRWPQQPAGWLAYGNLAFAQGDYAAAEGAFRRVTAIAPEQAQGWNNLAYAAARQHCVVQAQHAAQCALRLAPADTNIQATWQEMTEMTQLASPVASTSSCQPVVCPAK